MMDILWVGLGGCVGSVLRHLVGVACAVGSSAAGFPYGTLVVNGVGCLLMGVLQGMAMKSGVSKEIMLLLGTGVLGGFTTFSAFGWDWLRLIQSNRLGLSLLYVAVTLGLGFLLVCVGVTLGWRMAAGR